MGSPSQALQRAICCVLLRPAARWAARCGMSLSSFAELAENEYFRDAQAGQTVTSTTEKLQVGLRTAFRIKARLAADAWIQQFDDEERKRQVLFEIMVKPRTVRQLMASSKAGRAEIESALAELVARGAIRIKRVGRKLEYVNVPKSNNFVDPRGFGFAHGIHALLRPLLLVLEQRHDEIFGAEPKEKSSVVGSTLSFVVPQSEHIRSLVRMREQLGNELERLEVRAASLPRGQRVLVRVALLGAVDTAGSID